MLRLYNISTRLCKFWPGLFFPLFEVNQYPPKIDNFSGSDYSKFNYSLIEYQQAVKSQAIAARDDQCLQ